MIFGKGSGGWGKGTVETPGQLYHLKDDLAETTNLYTQHPDIVAEMTALMERIITEGRSSPGKAQRNDAPVKDKFLPAVKPAG